MGIVLEETNYIFGTKNKNKQNSNSLEAIYSNYSYISNKSKEITYWEIKNEKKTNAKSLWSKREEMSKLKIKCRTKFLYANIDGLFDTYVILLKNAKEIFSDTNIVKIVNDANKTVLKVEPKDLKIIFKLLTILDKNNAKYLNALDDEVKNTNLNNLILDINNNKFKVEDAKIKIAVKEKLEKNGIDIGSKVMNVMTEIKNNCSKENMSDVSKVYYIKVKLFNSEIIETAENPHSYKETMELYQKKKDVYKFADVFFIKEETGKESIILFSKPKEERDYLYSGTLSLYMDIINNYNRITKAIDNISTEISVKDKELSSYRHKLENSTVINGKDANNHLNTEKILMHERRDVKLARLLNNLMSDSLKTLSDFEVDLNNALKKIDEYIKYGEKYEQNMFRMEKYKYKNEIEKEEIISELSEKKVDFKINSEEKHIYVYI